MHDPEGLLGIRRYFFRDWNRKILYYNFFTKCIHGHSVLRLLIGNGWLSLYRAR